MSKPLSGSRVAILLANGFNEQDLTHTQRALRAKGAHTRLIGMDNGLVNSWTGSDWGHSFAADGMLSTMLAADFDMLIIPSGRRSVEKLKLTAHTRRFINGFMDAEKPVAIFDDAIELMVFAEKLDGRTVSCPDASREQASQVGAEIVDEPFTLDGNLVTGYAEAIDEYIDFIISSFDNCTDMKEAA
ncbi:MAG: DJ-1/PfpI family protein [Alphaproteobacteria bacterium]